jgi:hypothetical protein
MVLIREVSLDARDDCVFIYAVTDEGRTFRTDISLVPGNVTTISGLSHQTSDDWASSELWTHELIDGRWMPLQAPPDAIPITLTPLNSEVSAEWRGVTAGLSGPWFCNNCGVYEIYLDGDPGIATCVKCNRVFKVTY